MIAAYRSRSERHGGTVDELGLKRIERQSYTDHIDDGVNRANLVKMHLFERNAVNFTFGDADFFEDGQRISCYLFVKSGGLNQLDDIRVMPVMCWSMFWIKRNVHFQRGYASFVDALPLQLERLDPDFLQFAFDISFIGACVDQRGQRHIAANAGETIEIYDTHESFTTFSTYFC